MKIGALVIGVSNYIITSNQLPYAQNDVRAIAESLENDLFIPAASVTTLSGHVTADDFNDSLEEFLNAGFDTGVLYYSGHGCIVKNAHHIALSDRLVPTNEVIKRAAKSILSLLVIIDSCNSGAAQPAAPLDSVLRAQGGDGCAILAASSPFESAWCSPELKMSVFTYYLSKVLSMGYSKARGRVELANVERIMRLAMQRRSLERCKTPGQQVVFKNNVRGNLSFPNPQYEPYERNESFPEHVGPFRLSEVDSLHTGIYKRYSIKLTVGTEADISEIERNLPAILAFAKGLDVYKSKRQEQTLKRIPATHVFMYFGADDVDLIGGNWICRVFWVDSRANQETFYRGADYQFKDMAVFVNRTYSSTRKFLLENQFTDDDAAALIAEIADEIDTTAITAFSWFDDYRNGAISEQELIARIESIKDRVDALGSRLMNCGFASKQYEPILISLMGMSNGLQNVVLFYTSPTFLEREESNRVNCMEDARRYYMQDVDGFLQKIAEFDWTHSNKAQ